MTEIIPMNFVNLYYVCIHLESPIVTDLPLSIQSFISMDRKKKKEYEDIERSRDWGISWDTWSLEPSVDIRWKHKSW